MTIFLSIMQVDHSGFLMEVSFDLGQIYALEFSWSLFIGCDKPDSISWLCHFYLFTTLLQPYAMLKFIFMDTCNWARLDIRDCSGNVPNLSLSPFYFPFFFTILKIINN